MSEGATFKPGRLSYVYSMRDLLGEVRERPPLFLSDKSLTGLKCLLFGYEIACAKHGISEADQLPDDIPWRGFSEWLAKRYDQVGRSVDWHGLLVEHSPSQEEAFDRFFELLDEYEAAA